MHLFVISKKLKIKISVLYQIFFWFHTIFILIKGFFYKGFFFVVFLKVLLSKKKNGRQAISELIFS